ncbi:hypothetical protein D3C73_1444770 [compost metagenome]
MKSLVFLWEGGKLMPIAFKRSRLTALPLTTVFKIPGRRGPNKVCPSRNRIGTHTVVDTCGRMPTATNRSLFFSVCSCQNPTSRQTEYSSRFSTSMSR